MTGNKPRMTERERVEALLRRETPDRVPSWPCAMMGFCTLYTGHTIAEAYNNPMVSYNAQKKASRDFGWVFLPCVCHGGFGAWEFGGKIRYPKSEFDQAPMPERHPIETVEEAYNLKMPDVKSCGFMPFLKEFMAIASEERGDNQPFNVTALCGMGPFSTTANIPGAATFVKWMLKEPEVVHHLMRMGIDFFMAQAEWWKEEFGTEGVLPYIGEPTASNQLISPKMFETFVMPYLKEFNGKLIEMGFKHLYAHICGEHNKNLPYWAQIPWGDPGFMGCPQEIELEKMAEFFPNDIIVGNLVPAIVQTETPDNVYEATREVIEKGKNLNTGFIFSQGCELPPKAPMENIRAMEKAVEDFGYY